MRNLPIDLQARYYLATGDVDDILIGNYPASDEELEALAKVNFQAMEIKIDEVEGISANERKVMYECEPHTDRYDHSSFMLRSSMPRIIFNDQVNFQAGVDPDSVQGADDKSIPFRDPGKKVFTKGDILVVNDNLKHYRGELEIVLTEIPNDGERNLVGHVKEEELALLDFIKPGQHFRLIKE